MESAQPLLVSASHSLSVSDLKSGWHMHPLLPQLPRWILSAPAMPGSSHFTSPKASGHGSMHVLICELWGPDVPPSWSSVPCPTAFQRWRQERGAKRPALADLGPGRLHYLGLVNSPVMGGQSEGHRTTSPEIRGSQDPTHLPNQQHTFLPCPSL